MQILFLTQVLPYPLDAGPKVRAYYVLRHLAQTHEVTLVSFVRPTDTPAAVEHLRKFCQSVQTLPIVRSKASDMLHLARSLVTGRSFIIARDWVPEMIRLLDRLAAEPKGFDAVHADQLWMAPYALASRNSQVSGRSLLTVLDQHNAVHLIPARLAEAEANPVKRALLGLEARKMARYEVDTCRRFDRVVWVTSQDHEAVERQAAAMRGPSPMVHRPSSSVPGSAVIPICGDAEETAPVTRRPGGRRVTFLGGLHYPPNAQGILWFAERVWPQVVAQVPDAVLTVIGKSPPAGLNSVAPNLQVVGYVDDPVPYLEETAAFVVPLLAGGGMRVKIVDAWMWGLPVVSTSIGAEGIEIRPGENVLIADSPEDLAHAVVRLLKDPSEGDRLAGAGRRWAERHYDWRSAYQAWDGVYGPPSRWSAK